MSRRLRVLWFVGILFLGTRAAAATGDFVAFETGPVRPLALSADGQHLYVANIPDGRLEIVDVTASGLVLAASVPVGVEPCAVAVAPDGRVWVVNHLSDSISIVDASSSPPRVERTLLVGDEPRDIVFAGPGGARAFITTAHRGQHRTHGSISAVPGAGDPQLTTPGVGRADVWVFDSTSLGTALGGTPLAILTFFADTPRALAASADGGTVYVAAFHSGNQTTTIPEPTVCDGFASAGTCTVDGLTAPGGNPGPADDAAGEGAPETGLIVRFDRNAGAWRDELGRNWSDFVRFDLPDHDVFSIDASTLDAGSVVEFDHVGTILFNMTVNPITGKLYVTNTESPNEVRFEGPGLHGGSTVQGHLSEARITVIDPGGSTVDPQHLNQHIDYAQLHTDPGADHASIDGQIEHSLATPLQPIVSSDGGTLYVAAFGSSKVGVFATAAIEDPLFEANFDPTAASASYLDTAGGGASGLALDEPRDRLYVLTRFNNAVDVIDLSSGSVVQTLVLHNPEPGELVEGRPFLYDATLTSGNGEASCASCHVFGDLDSLAWDLGDPDAGATADPQPSINAGPAPDFHSMKGPMTTQTLRGLSTHGAMHWRGDRANGFLGEDPCSEPTGAGCSEHDAFFNFIVAFEGLVGRNGVLAEADMEKFTAFALRVMLPPNPVRALDNSLTAAQAAGDAKFFQFGSDAILACNSCHVLDPAQGFFGTGGASSDETEPQRFKIAHLRNLYQKVGMFGRGAIFGGDGSLGPHQGPQVRGFGFLHDGSIDTVAHFLEANVFPTLTTQQESELQDFILAFDSDLAPIVGQQVTRTATNGAVADPRIDLLIQRASTAFDSLVLGGTVTECDLVVKGNVGLQPRGWLRLPDGSFQDDTGAPWTDGALRALATSDGPLTYTCVPPGSGTRWGLNRDRDAFLDGLDNCPGVADNSGTDTDGDGAGDACDPDDDNDGTLDGADCSPADATTWALPGEALDLMLSHDPTTGTSSLAWAAPHEPGGAQVRFDTLRADAPDALLAGSCLETDDAADTTASDGQAPGAGATFYYLVRAGNSCGEGTLGTTSTGDPRAGLACGVP